jgi:DNA-binding transcriptional regulator YhcF (GntR family)
VDTKSHVPMHVQLEEQIMHLILTGKLKVGSRWPIIGAIAAFCG